MNRFHRKAKQESTSQSKNTNGSSSKTPRKVKEPLSESDSRSEKTFNQKPALPPAKPENKQNFWKRSEGSPSKSRGVSPKDGEKKSALQKIRKNVVNMVPFSPAKKHKSSTPQTTTTAATTTTTTTIPLEVKRVPRQQNLSSDSEQELPKKSRDTKQPLPLNTSSNEQTSSDSGGASVKSFDASKPKPKLPRVERSLIGLDGETEIAYDRKSPKPPPPPPESPVSGVSVKKRLSEEESSASETKESISLADDEEARDTYRKLFKEFAMGTQKLTLDEMKNDFSLLPDDPSREQCVAFNSAANVKKNRYSNIPCLDSSRVRLTFTTSKLQMGNDYIHANYIRHKFLRREYILTQGPKKETIADFWRMIWQEKSTAIVMLCQFVETNREKCVEYFPRNAASSIRFDKMMLTYEESTVNKSVVTTRLRLQYENDAPRHITHFHWKEWPDYQVPGSSEVMLKILRKIRARSTPPVIHCAAGVGRSGTFVAVEIALQAINEHFALPDIRQIVTDLRTTGRASSVQTLQQYMLIWKVVLDFGVSNKLISEEVASKFASTYRRSFRHLNSS